VIRPVSDCCLASLEETEGRIITYYVCRECCEPCGAMASEWEAAA
jgi:hypothetical protein